VFMDRFVPGIVHCPGETCRTGAGSIGSGGNVGG
jgi:hypothetical protein